MRSKVDEKNERVRKGKRPRRPLKGGKALQRLLAYLAARDPQMIGEVVDTVHVPAAARPKVGPAARALSAPSARKAAPRTAAAPAAARTFARGIARAAEKVRASQPRATRVRRARRALAAPAVNPAAWTPIGPFDIPNGQTYGTNTRRRDRPGVEHRDRPRQRPNHLLRRPRAAGSGKATTPGSPGRPHRRHAVAGHRRDRPSIRRREACYAGSGEGNFYVNLGAGLYRSTDGGTTWRCWRRRRLSASASTISWSILQSPGSSTRRPPTGFYVSTNGGRAGVCKRGGPCWDISRRIRGAARAEILATFADGLFVSTNTGGTFTPVSLPSAPAALVRLAVDRVAASPDVAYVFGSDGNSRISGGARGRRGRRSRRCPR